MLSRSVVNGISRVWVVSALLPAFKSDICFQTDRGDPVGFFLSKIRRKMCFSRVIFIDTDGDLVYDIAI